MVMYWPAPGFKGRTFEPWVLDRWVFHLCIWSSPLRGKQKSTSAASITTDKTTTWSLPLVILALIQCFQVNLHLYLPSPLRFSLIATSRWSGFHRSHGNEVLLWDTTHLIQRLSSQWGSPCQDPAGNGIIRKLPDHHKEMQTVVVWSCLLFIWSGQNHLARHSERGKKTRQTEEEVGRQHQEMDRPEVHQV